MTKNPNLQSTNVSNTSETKDVTPRIDLLKVVLGTVLLTAVMAFLMRGQKLPFEQRSTEMFFFGLLCALCSALSAVFILGGLSVGKQGTRFYVNGGYALFIMVFGGFLWFWHTDLNGLVRPLDFRGYATATLNNPNDRQANGIPKPPTLPVLQADVNPEILSAFEALKSSEEDYKRIEEKLAAVRSAQNSNSDAIEAANNRVAIARGDVERLRQGLVEGYRTELESRKTKATTDRDEANDRLARIDQDRTQAITILESSPEWKALEKQEVAASLALEKAQKAKKDADEEVAVNPVLANTGHWGNERVQRLKSEHDSRVTTAAIEEAAADERHRQVVSAMEGLRSQALSQIDARETILRDKRDTASHEIKSLVGQLDESTLRAAVERSSKWNELGLRITDAEGIASIETAKQLQDPSPSALLITRLEEDRRKSNSELQTAKNTYKKKYRGLSRGDRERWDSYLVALSKGQSSKFKQVEYSYVAYVPMDLELLRYVTVSSRAKLELPGDKTAQGEVFYVDFHRSRVDIAFNTTEAIEKGARLTTMLTLTQRPVDPPKFVQDVAVEEGDADTLPETSEKKGQVADSRSELQVTKSGRSS